MQSWRTHPVLCSSTFSSYSPPPEQVMAEQINSTQGLFTAVVLALRGKHLFLPSSFSTRHLLFSSPSPPHLSHPYGHYRKWIKCSIAGFVSKRPPRCIYKPPTTTTTLLSLPWYNWGHNTSNDIIWKGYKHLKVESCHCDSKHHWS